MQGQRPDLSSTDAKWSLHSAELAVVAVRGSARAGHRLAPVALLSQLIGLDVNEEGGTRNVVEGGAMESNPPVLQIPDAARMKMHLRVRRLAGRSYHLVTLRPSVEVRFSTNFYHNTWHIVSDVRGSRLLARLLWGLAYQKQPGTLVLIDDPHLAPTPFDGARSDPVILLPSGLTSADEDALRVLKERLPHLGQPDQTIRWQTFGLDRAMALDDFNFREQWRVAREQESAERMSKRAGFICYSAPPPLLRLQALRIAWLRTENEVNRRMDYHYLADGPNARSYADGEVQIFHDYRPRVQKFWKRRSLAGATGF
jgi:hypothetical protein